jgi:hypothetical protein
MTKKHLMKSAHKIAKGINKVVGNYQIALSIALKEVWRQVKLYEKKRFGSMAIENAIDRLTETKEEKESKNYSFGIIPNWIMQKNLTNQQLMALNTATVADMAVVRETEKAKQFAWTTDFGMVTMWAPKSVLKA